MRLRPWLSQQPHVVAPLFACDPTHVVSCKTLRRGRQVLCRHPDMERAMIRQVTTGLQRPEWTGLLYVMAWGHTVADMRPLYIGRTGRLGRKGSINSNIENIEGNRSKFARWGDGRYYHMGDLSHAIFHPEVQDHATQKYARWAETLFTDQRTRTLREPTFLFLFPWTSQQVGPNGEVIDLVAAESLAIRLAIESFEDLVLNIEGEQWWAPSSRSNRYSGRNHAVQHPVQWVDDPASLQRALSDIRQAPVIGLDVETTLYTQRLCLVQLATPEQNWLFDALTLSPALLKPVLEAPYPLKVAHNASFERRILAHHGVNLTNVYDTYRASRRLGEKPHGLAAVCERLLGLQLDKRCQKSDWRRRPLSTEQIQYAALDAEVLLPLHEAMQKRIPSLPFAQSTES